MSDRMQAHLRWQALAAAFALAIAADASAQLYKCKGPDGKVVYSDRRCEATETAGKLAPGVSNRAHEIEEKAAADKAAAEKEEKEARLQGEARAAAESKAIAEALKAAQKDAPPARATPAGPYAPTSSERERIRDLEITAASVGATREQKEAARMEIASIRSGREARMSASDRELRQSLDADLSSADAKKRQRALQDLRSIYYR